VADPYLSLFHSFEWMIGEHKIKVDGAIHLCGHNFEHGDVPRERKVTLPGIVVHTVTFARDCSSYSNRSLKSIFFYFA
jgi:hypothetical protein